MSTQSPSCSSEVSVSPEASGAIQMADAIIRYLEGQISVASNFAVEDAYKKAKKEVAALRQHAVKGMATIQASHIR